MKNLELDWAASKKRQLLSSEDLCRLDYFALDILNMTVPNKLAPAFRSLCVTHGVKLLVSTDGECLILEATAVFPMVLVGVKHHSGDIDLNDVESRSGKHRPSTKVAERIAREVTTLLSGFGVSHGNSVRSTGLHHHPDSTGQASTGDCREGVEG